MVIQHIANSRLNWNFCTLWQRWISGNIWGLFHLQDTFRGKKGVRYFSYTWNCPNVRLVNESYEIGQFHLFLKKKTFGALYIIKRVDDEKGKCMQKGLFEGFEVAASPVLCVKKWILIWLQTLRCSKRGTATFTRGLWVKSCTTFETEK